MVVMVEFSSRPRVYEVARIMGVSSADVLDASRQLGFSVSTASSSLDVDAAKEVCRVLSFRSTDRVSVSAALPVKTSRPSSVVPVVVDDVKKPVSSTKKESVKKSKSTKKVKSSKKVKKADVKKVKKSGKSSKGLKKSKDVKKRKKVKK